VVQIPVFTYGIACLVGIDRVDWRRVLGIVVALGGAVLLILERQPAGAAASSRLGDGMILANCLAYSGYLVLARRVLGRFPALVVMAWIFWLSLPAVPLLVAGVPVWPAGPSPRVVGAFAGMLVIPTFLAYVLNAYALARIVASTVAVFIFLQPLVAGTAGLVLLEERLTGSVVVAGLSLLAGIALVAFVRRPSGEPDGSDGSDDAAGPRPADQGARGSIQRLAGRVFHSRR